jgi:hypothetical protein
MGSGARLNNASFGELWLKSLNGDMVYPEVLMMKATAGGNGLPGIPLDIRIEG